MKMIGTEILKRTMEIVFVVGTLTHVAKTQGHPSLLCAHRRDIRKLNLEDNEFSLLFRNLSRSVAIDYHYAEDIVIWTDVVDEKIYSAPMRTDSIITTLVDDCVTPDGVAVDWIHDNVYWTDTGKDVIGVTQLKGGFVTTLFSNNLYEPRAIVLNPLEGWMFWTDWGDVPKIERSGMDGTHRSVIVSRGIKWPNGLAIDLQSRKIFWADGSTHVLCSADYDGSNQRFLISSEIVMKHPFALDEFENFLYWSEWSFLKESVFRANKDGENVTKVVGGENWSNLMGIKVYHSSKQPDGPNKCGADNGGCSSICLPAPDLPEVSSNFTCACPTGMFLLDDGKTCSSDVPSRTVTERITPWTSDVTPSSASSNPSPSSPSPEVGSRGDQPYLLCANRRDIRKVDPETGEYTAIISNLKLSKFFDYNYAKNIIVWSDLGISGGAIYSAPLEHGAPIRKLIDGFPHLEYVVVDWIHDKLYWTDSELDAIGVVTFDGSSKRTLFEDNFDEPRPLVLNPLEGWMFWADWGRNGRIERGGMDGSHRSVIVPRLVRPKGLAIVFIPSLYSKICNIKSGILNLMLILFFKLIYFPSRRIYWIDAGTYILASVTYNGSDKLIIRSTDSVVRSPYSLDIFEDWAYWTQWTSGNESVYRTNISSERNVAQRVVGGSDWYNLMGIRIFHQSKQPPGPNRCGSNNGGCSDLCLPAPEVTEGSPKYTCACPDENSHLEDGLHCSKSEERPTLLYANKRDIRNVDLDTKRDVAVVSNLQSASFVDYHFEKDIIVWTDSSDKIIYSAPLKTGMPITPLVYNCVSSGSVAVDWIHDKIYWTDTSAKTIAVAMLNGSFVKTLLKDDLDYPKEIVINPLDGWMFWTDAGSNPKIERSGMDGSYRTVIVVEDARWTNCLTIDYSSQKIYWADSNTRALCSVDYDGANKRVIWESRDALRNPYSLDVFDGSFFWTKWTSQEETIFKLRGSKLTEIVEGKPAVVGIKIYHRSKQPPGPNRCGANNGGCSHLCLPSPDRPEGSTGFSCACPDGLFLSQNGLGCLTVENKNKTIISSTPTNKVLISPTPESEGQWSYANESERHSQVAMGQSGAKTGVITIAALIGLSIVALIGFYVYKRYYRRPMGYPSFDNPVYCKTTEDELSLHS